MAKIITIDTLKEERRNQTVVEKIPYVIRGEQKYVEKRLVNGEMELIKLDKPLGEMMTAMEGVENLLKKVALDVDFGREAVPLLYKPIYRTITNADFPQIVPINEFVQAQVVFLQHIEGQQIEFGTRRMYTNDGVPIITWTAGFDGWTLETEKFDATWSVEAYNRALGEAYNALLNHLHFYPILSETGYATKNHSSKDTTSGLTYLEKLRQTLRAAIQHANADLNPVTNARRNPSIVLCSTANLMDIQDALGRMVIGGTEYPALGQLNTIIAYDGWSVTVGANTYTYPGVSSGVCYLIDPKRYFMELVKADLTIETGEPDTTRLVRAPIVAWAMRGVLASPLDAVEEVELP